MKTGLVPIKRYYLLTDNQENRLVETTLTIKNADKRLREREGIKPNRSKKQKR